MKARALVLVDRAWTSGVDLVRVWEVCRVRLRIAEAVEDDVARFHRNRGFTVSKRDRVCDSGDTGQACELWIQSCRKIIDTSDLDPRLGEENNETCVEPL